MTARAVLLVVHTGRRAALAAAREIAARAVAGDLPDRTQGANHFHTHRVSPSWSRGVEPVVIIGGHRFFRL